MKETPTNRPVDRKKLASALKRNMARRKAVVRVQGSGVSEGSVSADAGLRSGGIDGPSLIKGKAQ